MLLLHLIKISIFIFYIETYKITRATIVQYCSYLTCFENDNILYKETSYWAPIVFIDGAFYVVGGRERQGVSTKTIARFDALFKTWSEGQGSTIFISKLIIDILHIKKDLVKGGELVTARSQHNAIFTGESLIVVGGYEDTFNTEVCKLSDGIFTCTEQDPVLVNYLNTPELFLVVSDYCT